MRLVPRDADADPARSYLIMLPGQLAPTGSGPLVRRRGCALLRLPPVTHSSAVLRRRQGSLAQLDTPNPVLYLDFLEARGLHV